MVVGLACLQDLPMLCQRASPRCGLAGTNAYGPSAASPGQTLGSFFGSVSSLKKPYLGVSTSPNTTKLSPHYELVQRMSLKPSSSICCQGAAVRPSLLCFGITAGCSGQFPPIVSLH